MELEIIRMIKLSRHVEKAEEIAKKLGISTRDLDYWVMMGVISPFFSKKFKDEFSNQDLTALRLLKEFVGGK